MLYATCANLTPANPLTGHRCQQVGPELEIPGYGCEDHFLEQDTIEHSWECVAVRAHKPWPLHQSHY